jgi:hypothetical protein
VAGIGLKRSDHLSYRPVGGPGWIRTNDRSIRVVTETLGLVLIFGKGEANTSAADLEFLRICREPSGTSNRKAAPEP